MWGKEIRLYGRWPSPLALVSGAGVYFELGGTWVESVEPKKVIHGDVCLEWVTLCGGPLLQDH